MQIFKNSAKHWLFGLLTTALGLIAIPAFAGDVGDPVTTAGPAATYRVIIGDATGTGVNVSVGLPRPGLRVKAADSGWIVTSIGLVSHCPVNAVCHIQVQDADRNIYQTAELAGKNLALGLALLRLEHPIPGIVHLADKAPGRGTAIETCGIDGIRAHCAPAHVLGANGARLNGSFVDSVLLTSAPYETGSDGSGNFAGGKLIGVTVGTFSGSENSGATVVLPVSAVRKFVKKLTDDYEFRMNARPKC